MKKTALFGLIGAMALGVNAGDWGKAPITDKGVYCPEDGPFEVSVGYMSHYIFRGYAGGVDVLWADVNYDITGFALPINVGISHHSDGSGFWSEMFSSYGGSRTAVYADAAIGNYLGFDVTLGGAYYFSAHNYEDNSFGEVRLRAIRDLGPVVLIFTSAYGLGDADYGPNAYDPKGFYNELALSKSFVLTDNMDLVLTGGVSHVGTSSWGGYYGYQGSGAGWNHYFLTLELPIAINCNMTFTPYIGWNGSPDGWATNDVWVTGGVGDQGDILHGGATFTVTF